MATSPGPDDSEGCEKRTISPLSPRTYSSYATINKMKGSLLSANSKANDKGASDKFKPSPKDDQASPGAGKSASAGASLLAYRIANTMSASKEASLLGAELEVFRDRNSELQSKLRMTEASVKRLQHQHEEEKQALQLELKQAKHDLEIAKLQQRKASTTAEAAVAEAECMRAAVEEQYLTIAEENEAALKCCWLARYWSLAKRFAIMPEVSHGKAEYWQETAPPVSFLYQIAQDLYQQVLAGKKASGGSPSHALGNLGTGNLPMLMLCGSDRSFTGCQTPPSPRSPAGQHMPTSAAHDCLNSKQDMGVSLRHESSGKSSRSPGPTGSTPSYGAAQFTSHAAASKSKNQSTENHQASTSSAELSKLAPPASSDATAGPLGSNAKASDMIEIERGMRELWELGVPWACEAAMSLSSHQSRSRHLLRETMTTITREDLQQILPPILSEDEQEEVQFLTAWLAFIWSQAALIGVEPQVSESKAVEWGQKMQQPASIKCFPQLHEAFREMRIIGIEPKMWRQRFSPATMEAPLQPPETHKSI